MFVSFTLFVLFVYIQYIQQTQNLFNSFLSYTIYETQDSQTKQTIHTHSRSSLFIWIIHPFPRPCHPVFFYAQSIKRSILHKCATRVLWNIVREPLFKKSDSRALFKKLSILIFICALMLRWILNRLPCAFNPKNGKRFRGPRSGGVSAVK